MNWFDIIVLLFLASGFVKGLFDGLVKQLVSVVSLVLAFVFSGTLADIIRSAIHLDILFSPATMNAIYYVLSFVFIISIFGLLAKFVDRVINYTPVGALNRLGGGIFGFVMCLLCLSFTLNVLASFGIESKIIHKETQKKSITHTPVKMALPIVYPYIKEFFNK
jgi:membrane protein required for colicin V production